MTQLSIKHLLFLYKPLIPKHYQSENGPNKPKWTAWTKLIKVDQNAMLMWFNRSIAIIN